MVHILDLEAERCPHAMSLVRTALQRAINGGFHGQVQIRTIERTMPDKLKLFISAMDSNLSITSTDIGELDPKRRLALLETGEINETQLAQLQNETLITVEVVQKV